MIVIVYPWRPSMSFNIIVFLIGFLIVGSVSFDVFQAIIVPRMTSRRFRIAPYLLGSVWWPAFRKTATALSEQWRNRLLDFYAPLSFVMLFVFWFILLICGFSAMIFSLRAFTQPPITSFLQAMYFAGTSVLTLGFGDVVASHWETKFIVLAAAMLGIIFMAMQVSFLFTLQMYLQQREQVVNTLNSRAGSPASGLVLLLRYQELGIFPSLSASFVHWENWLATIAESHGVYPLLLYFRSSSSSNSWTSSIGALCDAAALLATTIENNSVGEANMFYWLAIRTLKSLCEYMELKPVDGVHMSKEEFDAGLDLLRDSGLMIKTNRQLSWKYFCEFRSGYMRYLVPMCDRLLIPQQIWMIKLPI